MKPPSQSRHFNLHWLDRPSDWSDELEKMAPADTSAKWNWVVSHHQILTLAKAPENLALWFSITANPEFKPEPQTLLIGALLPGGRAVLVPNSRLKTSSTLAEFLQIRMKIETVLGTTRDLEGLGFSMVDIRERQTSWGKKLTNFGSIESSPPQCRRATPIDRSLLNRWARIFSLETSSHENRESPKIHDASPTLKEVEEWMRRGRLLLLETTNPVGMAALSGDLTVAGLGRSMRLSLVFIEPGHRRKGLGRCLLQAIEDELRFETVKTLVLFSDPKSESANRLYSNFGFQPSDDWLEVNVKTTG